MYELFTGDRVATEDRLNGAVILGPFPSDGLPIGGLTLIFTAPAETVTFSGAAGSLLTLAAIVSEINAGSTVEAALRKVENQGPAYSTTPGGGRPVVQMQIVLRPPSAALGIDKDGTSNPVLKLSTAADMTAKAPVAAEDIIGFSQSAGVGSYALIINIP
jgi:hypothetical protein